MASSKNHNCSTPIACSRFAVGFFVFICLSVDMGKSSHTTGIESLGAAISVKLPNGQAMPITMHKFDQMTKIYGMVARDTGAKESLIRIKYAGKVLRKHQSTFNLGLMSGMVLKAEVSVLFSYREL